MEISPRGKQVARLMPPSLSFAPGLWSSAVITILV